MPDEYWPLTQFQIVYTGTVNSIYGVIYAYSRRGVQNLRKLCQGNDHVKDLLKIVVVVVLFCFVLFCFVFLLTF